MKRILFATVASAALGMGGAALAADVPARAPVYKAPPVAAPIVYNWTGIYVGIQGGWAWANVSGTGTDLAGTFPGSYSYRPDGLVGGGHVGFNYQFPSNVVVGLEADIEASGIDGSGNYLNTVGTAYTHSTDIDWLGSVRGRLGYAFNNWLVYATGGFAWAKADYSVAFTGAAPFHTWSKTHTGWTLGAGVEYGFTPSLSGRLEYRYSDFGSGSDSNAAVNSVDSLDLDSHAVRIGLSYRFGGGPVFARY